MPNPIELQQIPDEELISLIKEDPEYISVIYKKTRDYCLRFLYKQSTGSNLKDEELKEIYQNAVIILYEKIIYEDFQLLNNATIQTYLNSVCRFQLLDLFKKQGKANNIEERENRLKELQFDPNVQDELREIRIQDEEQFSALEKGLNKMKQAGGNCYEILTLFWYHNKPYKEIARLLGYTTAANVKNQKARCQKRLRKIAHQELMTE